MIRNILFLNVLLVSIVSDLAACSDTVSCIKEAYEKTLPSGLSIGNIADSLGADPTGGSGALSSLKSANKKFDNLSDGDSKSSDALSSFLASSKTELMPIVKVGASLYKVKTVKSLHSDLLGLEIRKTIVYSESKIIETSEAFNEITEHSIIEGKKDAYRK